VAYPLEFTGKGTFKEEFVTAGGVDLKDINMKTMQSKIVPGLYFCGELINVDGVTGGYNFMNCWSTGYVAGESSVEQLLERIKESKGADWKHEKKAS
jgi:predicted flavoprotein YhiN